MDECVLSGDWYIVKCFKVGDCGENVLCRMWFWVMGSDVIYLYIFNFIKVFDYMLVVMLLFLRGYLVWKWFEGVKIVNRKVIKMMMKLI